jgi:molybdopterin converting factor small subunit
MEIRVRFFASLVDRTGCAEERVEIPPPADVGRLWETLLERHPELGRLGYRPAVACDLEYADWDHDLLGVAEVAFLPPVSGG